MRGGKEKSKGRRKEKGVEPALCTRLMTSDPGRTGLIDRTGGESGVG